MSCCFANIRVQPLDDIFEPVPILKNGKRHRRHSSYPMNVKKEKKYTPQEVADNFKKYKTIEGWKWK